MSARCSKCGAAVEDPARCSNGHAQPLDTLGRLAVLLGETVDYDLLADKVAERLCAFVPDRVAQAPPEPRVLVSATELARLTGMSTRWVYDHKHDLGAIPAGTGARPRLRFDPALATARLAAREGEGAEPAKWAPPPRSSSVPLLPVKDRAACVAVDGGKGLLLAVQAKATPAGAQTPHRGLTRGDGTSHG